MPNVRRRLNVGRAAIAALLVAAAASAGAAAPSWGQTTAPPVPSLTVLDTGTLEIKGKTGSDTADTQLTLFNPGSGAVHATVTFEASSDPGVTLLRAGRRGVAPHDAVVVPLEFTGLSDADAKVTGQLVVQGVPTPLTHAVSVTPGPQPPFSWPAPLVSLSVLAGLILFLWVVPERKGSRPFFKKRAPGTTFDFDKSWASTLTVLGGVFATVLTGLTYPDVPQEIDKDSLVRLNVLFAALIVVAPFVFHAIRRKAPNQRALKDLTGYLWGLVLACSLTFAAVIGQLACLALLSWELIGGGLAGWIGVAAVVIVMLLAVYYAFTTLGALAARNWRKEAEDAWKSAQRESVHRGLMAADTEVPAPQVEVATPRWSLL